MQNPIKKIREFYDSKKEQNLRADLLNKLSAFNFKNTESKTNEELEQILFFLEKEKSFLEFHKDTVYDFWGYFGFNEDESPAFFENLISQNNPSGFIYPNTPKILHQSVLNLETTEKLILYTNIEDFINACKKHYENTYVYSINDWQKVYDEIKHELLKTWVQTKLKYLDKIHTEDVANIDWNEFGKEIKPYLAPSYYSKPKQIEYSTDKNGAPSVTLTFNSSTSDSFRKVKLYTDNAYQAINRENTYDRDEDITKIWQSYYCELLSLAIAYEKSEKAPEME